MKAPKLFGFYAEPPFMINWGLILLPFVLLVTVYTVSSYKRHVVNPGDKLLPSIFQMAETTKVYAFERDQDAEEWIFPGTRYVISIGNAINNAIDNTKYAVTKIVMGQTGYIMLDDTISSLRRIIIGIMLSATIGLFLGIGMGLFPGFRLLALSFIIFLSIIPPLAILPILFIAFGTEEVAKVMLIVIGTLPMISRDMYLETMKIPPEQKTTALTLGASQLQVAYRIVLPQVLPRLIDTVRLSLGNAWLFLIAAEAIVSDTGLGYRIYVVRRRLAMDVILPYVAWVTLITYTTDYLLKKLVVWKFEWYLHPEE